MRPSQVADMLGGPVIFGVSARSASRRCFGLLPGARETHAWCAACSRAYPGGLHRLVAGKASCPYIDCDAELVSNAHAWSGVRELRPNYPAAPSMWVQYALPPLSRPYRHAGAAADRTASI